MPGLLALAVWMVGHDLPPFTEHVYDPTTMPDPFRDALYDLGVVLRLAPTELVCDR